MHSVARSCAYVPLSARLFASMPVATVNGVPIAYKLHEPTASPSRSQTIADGAMRSAALNGSSQQVHQTTASQLSLGPDARPASVHALGGAGDAHSAAGVGEESQRVLFICGLDARHDTEYFRHLVEHFAAQGCTVCAFDNRCGEVMTP